jgi:hypothetical protein
VSKLEVFLSHLTVESKLADILKHHLSRDFIGLVNVFVSSDRTSIPVGSQWLSETILAMTKASAHIVLCSTESVKRPWINFESGAAQIRDIPIIPICHSGFTPAQMPVPLSTSEGIEANAEGIKKLYDLISKMLGSELPEVDFDAFAKEIAIFEQEYREQHLEMIDSASGEQSPEVIENPRVLCVSSQQFSKLGFENQLDTVLAAFPSDIAHERIYTSSELRERLGSDKFDIVHIAAFVCPRTGDLFFSDVDTQTGKSTSSSIDVVPPDALSSLLEMAETQLVVITICESLVLAAALISVTNVVATSDMVSPKMMAAWVENFYGILQHKSVSQAFEFALKASRAPMRFYGRQSKASDFIFTVEKAKTTQA